MKFVRTHGRAADALRPVRITRAFTMHAEGSVLIEFGSTKVLCTASVEEKVPPHKRGSGEGWVTAEYGMLPRSTHTRSDRDPRSGLCRWLYSSWLWSPRPLAPACRRMCG